MYVYLFNEFIIFIFSFQYLFKCAKYNKKTVCVCIQHIVSFLFGVIPCLADEKEHFLHSTIFLHVYYVFIINMYILLLLRCEYKILVIYICFSIVLFPIYLFFFIFNTKNALFNFVVFRFFLFITYILILYFILTKCRL